MKKSGILFNKISVLIIVSFFIFCNVSIGQDSPLHYGIRLGLANSTFASNFQSINDNRVGFTGGGFASYDLKKSFSAEVDLLYLQQGITNTTPLTPKEYPASTNICFHTVEIPVLLCFNPHDVEGITPKVFIGHSFGYIINATASNKLQFDTAPAKYFNTKEDVSAKFNNMDFGVIFGIGMSFKAGSHNLILDARYKFGYSNMSTSEFDTFSNNVLTINAGLEF